MYHIQDYNHENPAGETFDAEGKLTHFNNCSDIYLIVGKQEALLIDLSNPIDWADNAAESLRALVAERVAGRPISTVSWPGSRKTGTSSLTKGTSSTWVVSWWRPSPFRAIRTDRRSTSCRARTCSSRAMPSGHGVWIFNENGFNQYVSAVPHLIAALEERGVNPDKLKVYGGHYWQKDWLKLPKGRELGMDYIYDMKAVLDEMEAGKAATEPSNLGRPNLDTYFRTWTPTSATATPS